MPATRLFAVIPAAGHSRRMGRAKLLLPFRGFTILGGLLQVLMHPRIAARCVVARKSDDALATEAAHHGAWVIQPDRDPSDMRSSVTCALQQIERRYHPADDDGWLLIPADHPLLVAEVLAGLIAAWDASRAEILVPSFQGRRGHPTLFRWRMAATVAHIPADRGLNWLLEQFSGQVVDWPCSHPEVTLDLDTPEDYARLVGG